MDPPRLGIFGGTFDPPHLGHLVVAGDVWETLGLDRLFFVPARLPPHRTGEMLTDPSIRLEMVREAVRGDPRFAASDVEVTREGPSFTVDTLRHFRDRHAEARLFVILGVDQFARIATWHEADRVVRLARMVVFARGGERPSEVDPGMDADYRFVAVTRIDISSSEVRNRVGAGRSIRHLVPGGVGRIIGREGLYMTRRRTAAHRL